MVFQTNCVVQSQRAMTPNGKRLSDALSMLVDRTDADGVG